MDDALGARDSNGFRQCVRIGDVRVERDRPRTEPGEQMTSDEALGSRHRDRAGHGRDPTSGLSFHRCPSSIGRGPRPRPGSSCATAPPSA